MPAASKIALHEPFHVPFEVPHLPSTDCPEKREADEIFGVVQSAPQLFLARFLLHGLQRLKNADLLTKRRHIVAHLSIGDKIPAHVSAQTSERGGKRTSSSAAGEEQRETSAPSDSVTLASGGPERLERPLSERISNAADALGALQRLQSQIRRRWRTCRHRPGTGRQPAAPTPYLRIHSSSATTTTNSPLTRYPLPGFLYLCAGGK